MCPDMRSRFIVINTVYSATAAAASFQFNPCFDIKLSTISLTNKLNFLQKNICYCFL